MDKGEDLRSILAKERNLLASERTRFAAERTISSWIRTGLAMVGAGFAIIRFIYFQADTHKLMAKVLGEVMITWGIVVLILSWIDYMKTCKILKSTVHRSNELWIGITVLVFTLVSLFLFIVTIS